MTTELTAPAARQYGAHAAGPAGSLRYRITAGRAINPDSHP